MSKLRKVAMIKKAEENQNLKNLPNDILGNYIKQSIMTNISVDDIDKYCIRHGFSIDMLNDPSFYWYTDIFKSKGLCKDVFNNLKQDFNLIDEQSIQSESYINSKANVLDILVDLTDVYNHFQQILPSVQL